MEVEQAADDQTHKKGGRHRKRLLYNSILNQMEFYFSDSNLTKDRMLSKLMQDDPYVDISIFMQFNRIRKLTTSIEDLTKAISKSNLIELSEDKTKVKRKEPVKIKENVDECTIYVERLKSDATHDWLTAIFSEFGNVTYVSIPRYKHNRMIKGFAFVEFETEEEAKAAVKFFESIDCKIPTHIEPQKLCSIATYEGDKKSDETANELIENVKISNGDKGEIKVDHETKKRKRSEDREEELKTKAEDETEANDCVKNESESKAKDKLETDDCGENKDEAQTKDEAIPSESINEDNVDNVKKRRKISRQEAVEEHEKKKKTKVEHETETNEDKQAEVASESEGEEKKKKKHKKSHKKKSMLKEIGIQILSKKEWKKMRNRYLDMQRKTMKQLKMHLNKQKFAYNYERKPKHEEKPSEMEVTQENSEQKQLIPGLIVKVSLPEPCVDPKKLKNEIKAFSSDIKYVDIPHPVGSEEIYVRFTDPQNAQAFSTSNVKGKACILEGDEEKSYWERIESSRTAKQNRTTGKQRGRDKLLKRAEKQIAKHVRFDDSE